MSFFDKFRKSPRVVEISPMKQLSDVDKRLLKKYKKRQDFIKTRRKKKLKQSFRKVVKAVGRLAADLDDSLIFGKLVSSVKPKKKKKRSSRTIIVNGKRYVRVKNKKKR